MRICDDLRQAVLQAAIQGKLTKQLPGDGDAAELLKQIAAEKAKLTNEGKIKNEKPLPEITADEIPFDIPDNWKWCRLGTIILSAKDGPHFSPPYSEKGIPFISTRNIVSGKLDLSTAKFISEENYKIFAKRVKPKKGDILYSKGGTTGIPIVNEYDGDLAVWVHIAVLSLSKNVYPYYLMTALKSPHCYGLSQLYTHGVGNKDLGLTRMVKITIPLPPYSEQNRIVSRVEELLARIDDLEKTETELEKLKTAFPGDMKAALLQAAMQGKLTEQLPEDGDAADLINQIAKEKNQLIKEGKIKKEKPLSEITPEEVPFDIPENWKWVRLGSIIYNRGQKTPDNDFTYIDISSIDNKTNRLGDLTNILSPNQAPSRARKIVQNGDIIYATVRPYLHNTCIIERDILPEPIVSTGFAVLSVTKGIYNRYLFRCLLSPMFDEYANSNENAKGVAYPAINDAKLLAAYIPLPPLAEQKRIVEKLDKLLPLCDGLVEE